MINKIGLGQNTCISMCASTYEKSIYEANKIKPKQEAKSVIKSSYNQHVSLNDAFSAREVNLENILKQNDAKVESTKVFKKLTSEGLKPSDYLHLIESHIPKELISSQNFAEIKNLASNLNDDLTSFFGFETRLMNPDARSDYLIAVSALNGEREALVKLLDKGNLPKNFLIRSEWQQLRNFALDWINSKSEIHNNVLGLWLEFDTAKSSSDVSIPSVFLQTVPMRIDSPKDIEKCIWVTRKAIPSLEGKPVSQKVEKSFIKVIKKLPKGASVFHVASMLSRESEGIRVVIKRINPDQIISYLNSVGWADKDDGLSKLLKDLQKFVDCIRLHINISEDVDPKIGLECFISPEKYNQENGWTDFLDYLVEKGLCQPELRSVLLEFPGVEQENPEYNFNLDSYMPSVKLPDKNYSKAIVRYISHVKISYEPNKPIEAKAYTGVRLLGRSH
jgi:hypothetical protein